MNNLLILRKKHNKKAVDLAWELNISRKHYYDLEKGNRRLNENHIKTFMEIYDCSADDILNYEYTKEDFQNNPEELDLEIDKTIRFLSVRRPIHRNATPNFPSTVIHLIRIHSEDIRRAHGVDFEFTPLAIMQLVREIDDFDFKLEFFRMLQRVKNDYLHYAKTSDNGHPVEHLKDYSRIENDINERFSGVLEDEPPKGKEPAMDYNFTPKEERDIARDLEKMLSDLESDSAMAFNGEPMDADDKEMLRISLENSMRLAKQMAKKKFTPNKHKK